MLSVASRVGLRRPYGASTASPTGTTCAKVIPVAAIALVGNAKAVKAVESISSVIVFVPVPRVEMSKILKDEREFYYDERQVQLANIVGKYHFLEKNIYDFAKMQKKVIKIKKT